MLKGNSSKKSWLPRFKNTAEADFGEFWIKFLGEFEAIWQTALACESGPWGGGGGGWLIKKNLGRKNKCTVPLSPNTFNELGYVARFVNSVGKLPVKRLIFKRNGSKL
jgi:hypothetical protein